MSPDGLMVAFVGPDNNIWLRKLNYNTEIAVTKDGKVNEVINGVPDWTYEEEFSTTRSMAWAPDNQVLCFLKYNESQVPQYQFPLYGGACDTDARYALYPAPMIINIPLPASPTRWCRFTPMTWSCAKSRPSSLTQRLNISPA